MFNKLLYKLWLIEAKEKIDMERGTGVQFLYTGMSVLCWTYARLTPNVIDQELQHTDDFIFYVAV